MAWDVQFNDGVHLPQIDWWLDARRAVARSVVSHAHSDHVARHREILCTAATARLMRARLPGRRTEHVLPFGVSEALDPSTAVTLLPAGHILGSALCLLEHRDHGRLLYTGDFKLRPGHVAEPCATPVADILIMETTFGRPHYVMPPAATVWADLVGFCRSTLAAGGTPVLFAYSLGKAQEVLAGLGPSGLPVMLEANAFRLTRIHEQLGVALPPYREFSAPDVAGHVVIAPPQSPRTGILAKIAAPRTAMVSGWALDSGAIYRYRCDVAFPLSDHADYNDLLRFVEMVRPRCVYTLHGFAQEFARSLRARGTEAWALGQPNQCDLAF
jgi:Cft2 family RNA processing exonuclease